MTVLELRADQALRRYYGAALQWANAERIAHSCPPLPRLFAGVRTAPGGCAVSRTVGNGLLIDGAMGFYPDDPEGFELPVDVASFVAHFDRGDYPALLAHT